MSEDIEVARALKIGNRSYEGKLHHLQTSDFAEIARLVKQYGGEYVSAGKSSHFRIPR